MIEWNNYFEILQEEKNSHIFTETVYSNPVRITTKAHGKVYSIQLYVIKFVSNLRQVGGFIRFPPPIKLTSTI
jgi:hypothetical protein